jgi:hypothetical protein
MVPIGSGFEFKFDIKLANRPWLLKEPSLKELRWALPRRNPFGRAPRNAMMPKLYAEHWR